MIGSTDRSAAQLLDRIQSLAQLDGLDVAAFVAQLEVELPPEREAGDAALRAALAAIDGFTQKAMRIRIDHALADDVSVGGSFRKHLAAMVVSYDGDALELLRERVSAVATRSDPRGAEATADRVAAAAGRALADRTRLRDAVLALAARRGLLAPPAEPEPPPEPPSREDLIELD